MKYFKKYHFKKKQILVSLSFLLSFSLLSPTLLASDYLQHPQFLKFLDEMETVEPTETKDKPTSEQAKKTFERMALVELFSEVKRQNSILEAIARPAEKTKTWAEYKPIFINDLQIKGGLAFWEQHKATFQAVEAQYKVPAEIILAIIGVETRYGQNKGRHRVLDALSTLAFDYPPRSDFFKKELKEFLVLTHEMKMDPKTIKGSYAGAMGFPQFISSSYRNFAVDFDGDNRIDLIENPQDAIASVANYFVKHGWQPGEKVILAAERAPQEEPTELPEVLNESLKPTYQASELAQQGLITNEQLPPHILIAPFLYKGEAGNEFWFGLDNFYVITRYNHSRLYAMAVYQLSQKLKIAITKEADQS